MQPDSPALPREAELTAAMKRRVWARVGCMGDAGDIAGQLFVPQMKASSSAAWEAEKSARWLSSASRADAFASTADLGSLAVSASLTEPSFVSVASQESRRAAAARMVEGLEQWMAWEVASLNAGLRRQERLQPRVVNVTPHRRWEQS